MAWIAGSIDTDTPYWTTIVAQMLLMGLGIGLISTPATESIMLVLPPARAGIGSAVHDATREDPSYAFALSRLSSQDLRYTPMGVFRSVQKPTYDAMMAEQLDTARAQSPADLDALLDRARSDGRLPAGTRRRPSQHDDRRGNAASPAVIAF